MLTKWSQETLGDTLLCDGCPVDVATFLPANACIILPNPTACKGDGGAVGGGWFGTSKTDRIRTTLTSQQEGLF